MRVLIANRGEIAVRYIQALHELEIESVALHTTKDCLHTRSATQTVEIPGASSYMDGEAIISVSQKTNCDAIAPGYGFLSESSAFAEMCEAAGITFVGPNSRVLAGLGDKSSAKKLADDLNIPVLPAQEVRTAEGILSFAKRVKFPIMIKAQDGGGGKGIRIVRHESEVENLLQEALRESPSQRVFVEKAALEGFKHIEIQVIGDRHNNIRTIFERECSLQRKFQKVVEIAPSSLPRSSIRPIQEAALKLARSVKYLGLGTFEFLVNSHTDEFFFMECNPRIQVEHTITEQISGLDLVHLQLAVVLDNFDLSTLDIPSEPQGVSIQCRLNAEDPISFHSSQGTLTSAVMPCGPGIRCDSILSNLLPGSSYIVTDEYDSLLAKLISTSSSYLLALKRALFALSSTVVHGVPTNQAMLLGLLKSDLLRRPETFDIRSLSQPGFVEAMARDGKAQLDQVQRQTQSRLALQSSSTNTVLRSGTLSTSALLKKGDAFDFSTTKEGPSRTIKIERILKNNFPTHLSADISLDGISQRLIISESTGSSAHIKADPLDPSQVALPFPGVLVEMLVDIGDHVDESEAVAVFRQGKMELDIRAPYTGIISKVAAFKEGDSIGSGALVVIIARESETKAKL